MNTSSKQSSRLETKENHMEVIIKETWEVKEIPFTANYMRDIGAMECGTLEWDDYEGRYVMEDWLYHAAMVGHNK